MKRRNGLVSELLLFLGVGEGFWSPVVRRGGTRCKCELCGKLFLAEGDGLWLGKIISAFARHSWQEIRVTFSLLDLGFDGARFPDLFCSSVQYA